MNSAVGRRLFAVACVLTNLAGCGQGEPKELAKPPSPSQAGMPAGNLLVNPSFEDLDQAGRPNGWNPDSSPKTGEGEQQAHSGRMAVHGTATCFTQVVPIEGGGSYSLGHFTRSASGSGEARLQVNFGDGSGGSLDFAIVVVKTGPEWTWNETTVVAPKEARVAVVFLVSQDGADVWFDDVWFGAGTQARQETAQGQPITRPPS